MRILHAPANMANQAWAAAQGLRSLGHEVEVWHYGPNPFGFPADRVLDDPRDPASLMRSFAEAMDRFDVFHFHFARSLIPATGGLPWFWDLPVLRALGKKVLFTFHGTDVRLRSVHLEEDRWSYYRFADVASDEERIARALDVIRTYADGLIVASVLNLAFVPEAVYVPKMLDPSEYRPTDPSGSREPLVVHVPSRRATKGTDFVLRVIEEVADRVPMRFHLAESLTNPELRALYADADIVIDNVLLGDCEVSALEAMAMGKPVITRIRDEVRAAHPDLPAVGADPDDLAEVLVRLIKDPLLRAELGLRGRAYVEATHDARVVARALEERYAVPTRPVHATFPGWVAPPREDKVPRLEERVRTLKARAADLDRRLEAKTTEAATYQRRLEHLWGSRAVRAALKARRALERLGISRARGGSKPGTP